MVNLVKKKTFCQKWRPLKKKGQNVSFKGLKNEKERVDSPETPMISEILAVGKIT